MLTFEVHESMRLDPSTHRNTIAFPMKGRYNKIGQGK